jgi:hypothetical protein
MKRHIFRIKQKLMIGATLGAAVLFLLTAFGLSLYLTAALWSECRQTNSVFFCLHVLSK